jgi:hypothetical protein
MSIFDQVRVPHPRTELGGVASKRQSIVSNSSRHSAYQPRDPLPGTSMTLGSTPVRPGGTMTRGPTSTTGKSVQIDQLQWLKSIRREERREGSRSGTDSAPNSRVGSRSRAASKDHSSKRRREESGSGSRDYREEEGSQTLQDECVVLISRVSFRLTVVL